VDKWKYDTPALNKDRTYASACSLGDSIFVFVGTGYWDDLYYSVERINVPQIESGKAAWELIQLPIEVVQPRELPVVVPLNKSEIVILGGCCGDDYDEIHLSDIVVFNVKTKACRKVSDWGDYKF